MDYSVEFLSDDLVFLEQPIEESTLFESLEYTTLPMKEAGFIGLGLGGSVLLIGFSVGFILGVIRKA